MFFLVGLLAQLVLLPKSAETVPSPAPEPQSHTAPTTGRIALRWHAVSLVGTVPANGDADLYPDTDETLDITLTLINKTGLALTDFVATLSTENTDLIECIDPYQVSIPSIDAGATFTTPAFRFKVGGVAHVNRSDVDQILEATFDVAISTDQFDMLDRPMRFTLPLDLDASPNSGTTTFLQDFEAGFGSFALQTLDAGKTSLAASDGMRCQYHDPDGPNSNDPGRADCFLGFPGDPPAGVNDWHIHDSSVANGGVGRAYTGSKSLHWGVHLTTTPARDTTRYKQMDAVKSGQINVPAASLHPELAFAHQVSLVDSRGPADPGETMDRTVVQVNVLNTLGLEGPLWKTVEPYLNRYEQIGSDDFVNCSYDPTDDGNDEDDYFDPSDPNRRLGPSSTCYPAYVFSRSGDTDYLFGANPARIGLASDGPGLTGSIDVGTWVESRVNLQEFAGRRIKIRFLGTSMELGASQTWDAYFGRNDQPQDDGWYIDTVRVSPAATLAHTVAADTKTITAIPCIACTSIEASLVATPNVLPEPGGAVTLDASASLVDHCKHGPPQYEFWIDQNVNGILGDAGDILLRAASDDPALFMAPDSTTQFGVVAGCRGEPSCDAVDGSNTVTNLVTVNCPPGIDRTAFGQTIRLDRLDEGFGSFVAVHWTAPKSVDIVRGCLSGVPNPPATACLKDGGSFTDSVQYCVASDTGPTTEVTDYAASASGSYYYLVRGQVTACDTSGPGYTTNALSENPGRDAELDADPVAGTCP